jgi:hypothetical protein
VTRLRVATATISLWLAAASLALAPSTALAADEVSFGRPDAVADYGSSITFTVDVTRTVPLDRVELRLRLPDTIGPLIVDVPAPPGTGTDSLQYELDVTGGGHIVPNTPITATWAAYTAPGTEPVLSRSDRIRYQDTTKDWRTVSGDMMTVHWYAGGDAFGKKALDIGEQAIRDTAELLGVTESEPVDFYIYGDQESFRAALGPGTRENVGGQAHADIRTLFALITPEEIDQPWVGVVVPHELVHLVFDTAVHNPYRFPPRWLNEGLAVYLSEGYGSQDRARVESAASSDVLIPLIALGGQFPTDAQRTFLAYAESVSAIDYLVRQVGQDALVELVTAYADGLTDDEAFQRAIGQDLASFQAGWLANLGAAEPQRYGPQPAPAGPLPSGWEGPPPTPGSGASPGASAAASAGNPAVFTPAPASSPDAAPAASTGSSSIGPVLLVLALVVGGVVAVVAMARRRMGADLT